MGQFGPCLSQKAQIKELAKLNASNWSEVTQIVFNANDILYTSIKIIRLLL